MGKHQLYEPQHGISNNVVCETNTNRTMARLNRSVVVFDHLNNRQVNCPPYTVVTISRNRLYLGPGIDVICLASNDIAVQYWY